MNSDKDQTSHKCPSCDIEYFQAQECDWCSVQVVPIPQEPVNNILEKDD